MGDSWSCLSCIGAEEAPVSVRKRGRGADSGVLFCVR